MPLMRKPISATTGKDIELKPSDVMIGGPMMVGGLPDGLNAGVLEELLKRFVPAATPPSAQPAVSALKSVASSPALQEAAYNKYIAKFFGRASMLDALKR